MQRQAIFFFTTALLGLTMSAQAQFEVVLVKERVMLNGQTVNVGQKIQQTDLDKLRYEGSNAMIAVYSPSQGRIVRPEREETVAQASGGGTTLARRNAELDQVAERLKNYFRSYVLLTDQPTLTVNLAELLKDDDHIKYITDFPKTALYTCYQTGNGNNVQRKDLLLLEQLNDGGGKITLSKNNLYHNAPAQDYFKTDIYVRQTGANKDSDSTLVKTVYLTYLNVNQAQELKKEVQTIKRANDAQGKSDLEVFAMVYQFMDKYYGTPLPSDLGLWLNQHFGTQLNTETLQAPAGK